MHKRVAEVFCLVLTVCILLCGCGEQLPAEQTETTETTTQVSQTQYRAPNPAPSALREDECGQSLTWQVSGSTLTVKGTGEMYDFTSAPWSSMRAQISSVVLDSGVQSIGDNAFCGLDGVYSVRIADSVQRIGRQAFSGCMNLGSVAVPNGVQTLEEGCFEGCQKLWSVSIPDSVTVIENRVFNMCDKLSTVLSLIHI